MNESEELGEVIGVEFAAEAEVKACSSVRDAVDDFVDGVGIIRSVEKKSRLSYSAAEVREEFGVRWRFMSEVMNL